MFHALSVLSEAFFAAYADDAEMAATIVAYIIKLHPASTPANELVN